MWTQPFVLLLSVARYLDTKGSSAEIQELQILTLKYENSGDLVSICCAKPDPLT